MDLYVGEHPIDMTPREAQDYLRHRRESMTDRAEAITWVKQVVQFWPDDDAAIIAPIKHLRALIAEPDERMVERVARAIASANGEDSSRVLAGVHPVWSLYIPDAKAAIAAIFPAKP